MKPPVTKPITPAAVVASLESHPQHEAGRELSSESALGMPPDAATMEVDREYFRLLTNELSEQAGDLRVANARLRALIDIGLEIASERDPDHLLHSVCAAARGLFGATYVTLGILDRNERTVQSFLTCGGDADCTTHGPNWIKTGDPISGILETVVSERRTLRGDNPGGDPARLHLPALHPEVQAFLAAPITSLAHVYGWICLVGNEGRHFTEDDEHLVLALSGQVGRIYELTHQILERKQAEAALRHERDRARRYLDTAEVILLALDLEGRITLINRKGCDLLGWTEHELLGRDWIATCLPHRTFHTLVGGDPSTCEDPLLTRSGEERLIEWRNTVLRDDAGRVIGTFSSGTDITERHTIEEQYRQAQKMEAIGRLAGGVAHDFNNLLTVILGYCELLLVDLDPDDPRQSDMAEIQKAGARAAGLTRQLLAFSRKELIEPTRLDLNVVVADMRSMLGRLIREDVKVVLNLQPELTAPVTADRGQMEQIVMNLAVNARDAMPGGGTLTIGIANVELDDHYAKTHLAVNPGPYVALTVTDTGTGMTPQVQARLFEPFFTTKELGIGTGLGLATVHGIVTQNGGSINVHSEVGTGTSFTVHFPRADAVEMVVASPPPVAARSRTGARTVLVVDDADELRELAKRLLLRQGYSVLVAANAEEAFEVFERNASIDVVLTDVVMPGASGPELSRRLVKRRPALKVIYMSGYTEEAIAERGVLNPGIAFLHKPFTAETLGRKIRDALDG